MKFDRPMAALCHALLNGKKVSIKTGFLQFGITNVPREISRSIEQKFNVIVERKKVKYTTTYGISQHYFEYTLLKSKQEKDSIERMYKFVQDNIVIPEKPDDSGFIQKSIF